ncbi:hypothetical protein BGZ54_002811 [Gamsiella multidivaricata]|nr:hypothetical protein BGZ54_002811 [Gamsiella multidivaricata]
MPVLYRKKRLLMFWCLILALVLLFASIPPTYDKDDFPLRSENVSLAELRYFTHDFANQGMGHKFSEVIMGLYFAKENGLQYLFNEKSFVRNFRHADLQWFGNLMKERYPVPPELLEDTIEGQEFNMNLRQWIPVDHYRGSTADAYAKMEDHRLRGRILGFGGRNDYWCTDDETGVENTDCFKAGFSFFNATRDIQDLLQATNSSLMSKQAETEQVDRLAIHIRLGDIQISESTETYIEVVKGMRQRLAIPLPADKVHFVYYQSSWPSWSNWKRLRDLKRALPNAHFHNLKSVEETVRFLIKSQYLMTSGSSLSYVAAYLCPKCHVISTMPKEYTTQGIVMTEDNYRHSFYYMDEWVPYIHYLC